MTKPDWEGLVGPEWGGATLGEVMFGPTSAAVSIRSDDRIYADVGATDQDDFVVRLKPKPPGEWQWTSGPTATVKLATGPYGKVRCSLRPASESAEFQPVGDTEAAHALGLEPHTWLSVRAIVETGIATVAPMTTHAAWRAIDRPPRVEPDVVARRLAELTRDADVGSTAASGRTGSAVQRPETVSRAPVGRRELALPPPRPDRSLGHYL